MYRDDESEFGLSLSSSEYLTHGASQIQREKEGLKKAVESGQAGKASAQAIRNLHTKVDLSLLNRNVTEGQKDEERKRREKQEKESKQKQKGSKMGTKTIKQQEQAEIEGAGTQHSADDMVRKEEEKADEQSQSDQEYQAQMG